MLLFVSLGIISLSSKSRDISGHVISANTI